MHFYVLPLERVLALMRSYKMYKININVSSVKTVKTITKLNDDGSYISMLEDPANTDYQAYLKWVAAGNTPEPADE